MQECVNLFTLRCYASSARPRAFVLILMPSKPMTITVNDNAELVLSLPARVRRQAGIKAGDQLEVKAIPGVITIVAKPQTAEAEYSPEQRRAIKAEVVQARKGPYHGPFKSGDELAAYMKNFKRSRLSNAKKPR